jgi:hypothetical protein
MVKIDMCRVMFHCNAFMSINYLGIYMVLLFSKLQLLLLIDILSGHKSNIKPYFIFYELHLVVGFFCIHFSLCYTQSAMIIKS